MYVLKGEIGVEKGTGVGGDIIVLRGEERDKIQRQRDTYSTNYIFYILQNSFVCEFSE